MRCSLALIDNYDSFTYNLVHCLGELGARSTVLRNDAVSVADVLALHPDAIVISPGPGVPQDAGISVELVRTAADAGFPVLGVCLGHQAIGHAFGGRIVRAGQIVHGKTARIRHGGSGLFDGLPSPFQATRYHSLVVDAIAVPAELEVTARTEDGLIMGLSHRTKPVFGVQFHPESIASEHGRALLDNFLKSTHK